MLPPVTANASLAPRLVADGGRVLNVVGVGPTVEEARSAAYRGVEKMKWPKARYRIDIAG